MADAAQHREPAAPGGGTEATDLQATGVQATQTSRLEKDGQPQTARMTDAAAGRVAQLAGYLEQADGERLMSDVQDLARRNPWAFAAAGFAAGFAASRFMKASRPSGAGTTGS